MGTQSISPFLLRPSNRDACTWLALLDVGVRQQGLHVVIAIVSMVASCIQSVLVNGASCLLIPVSPTMVGEPKTGSAIIEDAAMNMHDGLHQVQSKALGCFAQLDAYKTFRSEHTDWHKIAVRENPTSSRASIRVALASVGCAERFTCIPRSQHLPPLANGMKRHLLA